MTNRLITQGYIGVNLLVSQGFSSVAVSVPSGLGLLGKILANMENYSGIQTTSDNVCEPGMDRITSPLKTIIENLERN
jgi:hypothetical protein